MAEPGPAPDAVTVEELYQLRHDAFVAARDALAKALRADGDRDGSDAVKRLRKPPVTAWVVNRLSAEEPGTVDDLFAANDRLRAAMAGTGKLTRDRFRAASEERQRIVARLVEWARVILEEEDLGAGRANLDRITSTLMSTATDAAGADLVRARVLDHDLSPGGGFDDVLGGTPVDGGGTSQPAEPDPKREAATRRRQDRAERDAGERADNAKEADRVAAEAEREADDAEREAERVTKIAAGKRREADRARREADRAADLARTALERLTGGPGS